ncbi:MAG: flavodoxin FldA [Arsenophonus sp.]|nr:MAG: flavodoxin FldA [Arsenophonus sp.]
MDKIGIFFGSDTGNTENIAKKIHKELYKNDVSSVIYDISSSKKEDIELYNILIFGIPTWYYGESQCDWDDFFPILKKINLKNKIFAIFGCGDQEDYSEYFCDAMGIINNILKNKNGKIIGSWSTKNYTFEQSKALINKNNFVGLAIDEDRQPHLTKKRIQKWIKQILDEIKKINTK